MARAVIIKADSDDCSLTLTGEAAAKVWDYILEKVYIQRPLEVDVENKEIIGVIKEGYLGKV